MKKTFPVIIASNGTFKMVSPGAISSSVATPRPVLKFSQIFNFSSPVDEHCSKSHFRAIIFSLFVSVSDDAPKFSVNQSNDSLEFLCEEKERKNATQNRELPGFKWQEAPFLRKEQNFTEILKMPFSIKNQSKLD